VDARADDEADDTWAEAEAEELAAEETPLGTASGVSSTGPAIDQLHPKKERRRTVLITSTT